MRIEADIVGVMNMGIGRDVTGGWYFFSVEIRIALGVLQACVECVTWQRKVIMSARVLLIYDQQHPIPGTHLLEDNGSKTSHGVAVSNR